MEPVPLPEAVESVSHAWLLAAVQFIVPVPVLLTVKLCAEGLAAPAVPENASELVLRLRIGCAGGGRIVPLAGAIAMPLRIPFFTTPCTSIRTAPFVTETGKLWSKGVRGATCAR